MPTVARIGSLPGKGLLVPCLDVPLENGLAIRVDQLHPGAADRTDRHVAGAGGSSCRVSSLRGRRGGLSRGSGLEATGEEAAASGEDAVPSGFAVRGAFAGIAFEGERGR